MLSPAMYVAGKAIAKPNMKFTSPQFTVTNQPAASLAGKNLRILKTSIVEIERGEREQEHARNHRKWN